MYKWNANGEVELVPLPFSNGERDGEMGVEDEEFDAEVEADLQMIEKEMSAAQVASVPTTARLQLKVSTFQLGLFGTLKLALALQFIVTNAYSSVARNTKVSVHATLK